MEATYASGTLVDFQIISQKIELFITTDMETSNPNSMYVSGFSLLRFLPLQLKVNLRYPLPHMIVLVVSQYSVVKLFFYNE
jgi:hypothetical protein